MSLMLTPNPCLCFSSLAEEFNFAQAREVLLFQDFADTTVSGHQNYNREDVACSGGSWTGQGCSTTSWCTLWQLVGPNLGAIQDLATVKPKERGGTCWSRRRLWGSLLQLIGGYVQAAVLDQVGAYNLPKDYIGRDLEGRTTPFKFLGPVSV